MKKQPAEKSYVFDQGYKDVKNAFSKTWKQTLDSDKVKNLFSNILLFIPNLIAFVVITVFRILLNSVISIALVLAFLIVVPVVYFGFVIVSFLDLMYRTIKRISSVCPNCQYRFDLPTYICPTCGAQHTRLIPSKYGVFKRKCLCGQKLPTTFFNGRQKLKALCPQCGFGFDYLKEAGKHVAICIPVIGGPSAGKTCFINQAIAKIENSPEINKEYDFEYVSNGLNDYKDIIRDMNQGNLPEKTGDMRLKYYQFFLTPKNEPVKNLISLCDVGGEVYSNTNTIDTQVGFTYANAFIVVVDPLSISKYRREVEKTINISKYGASSLAIDEILTRMIATLENIYSISSKAMLKTDIAIVFTKCDFPGLDRKIGAKAVEAYIRSNSVTKEAAANILCEDFLKEYEEANFLRSIKSKFKTVQFFTCTSVGNIGGNSFVSSRVEEPVLWLINKILARDNNKK